MLGRSDTVWMLAWLPVSCSESWSGEPDRWIRWIEQHSVSHAAVRSEPDQQFSFWPAGPGGTDAAQPSEPSIRPISSANPNGLHVQNAKMRIAEAQLKKMSSLRGAAFDQAYAQNEVAYHQLVNDSLRKTLIPSANNAELKALLSTGLKIFEGHQQHAEHLVQGLK